MKLSIIKKIWRTSPQGMYIGIKNHLKKFGVNHQQTSVIQEVVSGPTKGIRLIVLEKPTITESAMLAGSYENYILDELKKQTEPLTSKCIWDIGAHIGYHTLSFAKAVGKTGKVVAFEPNPDNLAILKKNITTNQDLASSIMVRGEALSDTIGTQKMSVSKNKSSASSTGGYLQNVKPPLPSSSYAEFENITIQTTTIDQLIKGAGIPTPDILKIDVEGAELHVLQGARKLLESVKPILIIEIHTIAMMFSVSELLKNNSYELRIIDEKESSPTKNILAVPRKISD